MGLLLLGAGLLWPVPLGAVLFLVAGRFGLAISSEAELTQASPRRPNPAVVVPSASLRSPFGPQPDLG